MYVYYGVLYITKELIYKGSTLNYLADFTNGDIVTIKLTSKGHHGHGDRYPVTWDTPCQ